MIDSLSEHVFFWTCSFFLCRNLSEKRSIKTFFIVFCRKGRYNVKMLCYALGHQWNRKDARFGGAKHKNFADGGGMFE